MRPKNIKLVRVFEAQEHMKTIQNDDMNFIRSPKGNGMRPPAKTYQMIQSSSSCL